MQNNTTVDLDVGDVSEMSSDERTTALDNAMIDAGLDPNTFYVILGEVA